MITQTGKPFKEGIYVAKVYHGWKILEWDGLFWWTEKRTAQWCGGEPDYWIGPLPEGEQEYDL